MFPRVAGDEILLHAVSSWGDLRPSPMGMQEPSANAPTVAARDVDLAIIPGLGFSSTGARLGRGGGHYDRLLPVLRVAWGVAFDCQIVPAVPIQPHDRPVQRVFAASIIQSGRDGQT